MSNKKIIGTSNNAGLKNPTQKLDLTLHHKPKDLSDRFALFLCKSLRWLADVFFQKRYGHRAVVLETIAAVPGMIGGMLTHFKCLRRQCNDDGWIKTLLDEAENERMHLMTFIEIASPSWLEHMLIIIAQVIFSLIFFFLYLISSKTAHRLVGYLEEEAIISYNSYLAEIDNGVITNVPAPLIAINYWGLAPDAKLRDVVLAVQKDEAGHRDANHQFANHLQK